MVIKRIVDPERLISKVGEKFVSEVQERAAKEARERLVSQVEDRLVSQDKANTQAPKRAGGPKDLEPGIKVSYYDGSWNMLPNFDQVDAFAFDVLPDINSEVHNGQVLSSGRVDNVGAVLEGYVHVPATGSWTFGTVSDDGSRLFIRNQLVLDNDGLHGNIEKTGQIALEEGWHAVRVDYFENGGGSTLKVKYGGPGFAYDIIPARALGHTFE